jgi:hypothetical protein
MRAAVVATRAGNFILLDSHVSNLGQRGQLSAPIVESLNLATDRARLTAV